MKILHIMGFKKGSRKKEFFYSYPVFTLLKNTIPFFFVTKKEKNFYFIIYTFCNTFPEIHLAGISPT
jgi:hypothetical protein